MHPQTDTTRHDRPDSPAPPHAPTGTAPTPPRTPVSLLGLGAMGATLARTLQGAGHPITVWNRTASRTEPLVAAGAAAADDPRAAVAANDLVVLCLRDAAGVREVLDAVGPTLSGRSVVNLSSTTPEEARELAAEVTGAGGRYLDGAIMVPTPLVGEPDALFLYSGDRAVLDTHHATLAVLGGRIDHLGDDPGLASTYDLGMLGLYFAGMAGFLHAVALVEVDGITAERFLPYASAMVELVGATLPGLARDADARAYPGDEDTTTMELAFADHLVHTSHDRGIDTSVPDTVRRLLAAAVDRGHGQNGFSSVVEVLRAPQADRPAPPDQ